MLSGATALNAHFARIEGAEAGDPWGAVVIGLFAAPFGAALGFAGSWMVRRFGERGGVGFMAMAVAALVTGIAQVEKRALG